MRTLSYTKGPQVGESRPLHLQVPVLDNGAGLSPGARVTGEADGTAVRSMVSGARVFGFETWLC